MSIVYFVHCGDRIKIGFTRGQVQDRIEHFRSMLRDPITVLATIPGGRSEELFIHRQLREFALGREWFRDCPEMREAIARYLRNPPRVAKVLTRQTIRRPQPLLLPEPAPEADKTPFMDTANARNEAHAAFVRSKASAIRALPDGIRWSIRDAISMARHVYLSRIFHLVADGDQAESLEKVLRAFERTELLIANHLTCCSTESPCQPA